MDALEALAAKLREKCPHLELREYEPMSRHTSFRVGGPVRLMALPKTEEELQRLLCVTVLEFGVWPFFLGRGSNLLVEDKGFDWLAVKTEGLDRLEMAEEPERPGRRTVVAGSGVSLARLASFALDHGLTGLEFAHGIPGSVGGAVVMNAGAYGGEMGQVVSSVASVGFPEREQIRSGNDLGFSYRRSAFQEQDDCILRACFTLEPGDPAEIKARMEELAEQRRAKQPLEYPSAGSTFKRPEGHFAAALIDQCGLKGLTVGGAQVSEKHAGFIINRGGAACADILALMDRVREIVLRETGVELEPEIKLLGG